MTRPPAIALAMLMLTPTAGAAGTTQQYPPDVRSFIDRVSWCAKLSQRDAQARRRRGCDTLRSDRARLVRRYRGHPELIQALNGRWVLVVQRLPASRP
jgi:hypothetical protein